MYYYYRRATTTEEGFKHIKHHDTKNLFLRMQDCSGFLQIWSHVMLHILLDYSRLDAWINITTYITKIAMLINISMHVYVFKI